MNFFRSCDGIRICLVLPEDTHDKIARYAARDNLEYDLAMNDLISFGYQGEFPYLAENDAPPAGEQEEADVIRLRNGS